MNRENLNNSIRCFEKFAQRASIILNIKSFRVKFSRNICAIFGLVIFLFHLFMLSVSVEYFIQKKSSCQGAPQNAMHNNNNNLTNKILFEQSLDSQGTNINIFEFRFADEIRP